MSEEITPKDRKELASKYVRHMIYGVLWVVGGTVVTVATCQHWTDFSPLLISVVFKD